MKTPKLTRKVIRDHERLGDAIDGVLSKSKERRKLTKKILRLQDRLKRLVSVEAWHVYLKLEATVNERVMLEQEDLGVRGVRGGTNIALTLKSSDKPSRTSGPSSSRMTSQSCHKSTDRIDNVH